MYQENPRADQASTFYGSLPTSFSAEIDARGAASRSNVRLRAHAAQWTRLAPLLLAAPDATVTLRRMGSGLLPLASTHQRRCASMLLSRRESVTDKSKLKTRVSFGPQVLGTQLRPQNDCRAEDPKAALTSLGACAPTPAAWACVPCSPSAPRSRVVQLQRTQTLTWARLSARSVASPSVRGVCCEAQPRALH